MASFKEWLLSEVKADDIHKSFGYGPWRQANVYTKQGSDGRAMKSKETFGESYSKFNLLVGLSKGGNQFYAKLAHYEKNMASLPPKLKAIADKSVGDVGVNSAVRAAHDDYTQSVVKYPIDAGSPIVVGPLNASKHTILFFSGGKRVNAFASPTYANLMLQVKDQISKNMA